MTSFSREEFLLFKVFIGLPKLFTILDSKRVQPCFWEAVCKPLVNFAIAVERDFVIYQQLVKSDEKLLKSLVLLEETLMVSTLLILFNTDQNFFLR